MNEKALEAARQFGREQRASGVAEMLRGQIIPPAALRSIGEHLLPCESIGDPRLFEAYLQGYRAGGRDDA